MSISLKSFFAALAPRDWRELGRFFRNHRWEQADDGAVLIGHARIQGLYETLAPDGLGWQQTPNLMTVEGINYLLSVGICGGSGTAASKFYIAPFSGNVAVVNTLTATNFTATQSEISAGYSETTRVEFIESAPAGGSINNTANPATITSATDNLTIWGLGLLSVSTKSATTGVLLSAAKYTTSRTLPTTSDTLGIKYTLTLANS